MNSMSFSDGVDGSRSPTMEHSDRMQMFGISYEFNAFNTWVYEPIRWKCISFGKYIFRFSGIDEKVFELRPKYVCRQRMPVKTWSLSHWHTKQTKDMTNNTDMSLISLFSVSLIIRFCIRCKFENPFALRTYHRRVASNGVERLQMVRIVDLSYEQCGCVSSAPLLATLSLSVPSAHSLPFCDSFIFAIYIIYITRIDPKMSFVIISSSH